MRVRDSGRLHDNGDDHGNDSGTDHGDDGDDGDTGAKHVDIDDDGHVSADDSSTDDNTDDYDACSDNDGARLRWQSLSVHSRHDHEGQQL